MIVKRSMTIRGHRTSISIEDLFWSELRRIAQHRACPLAGLVASIDARRAPDTNLSSAIRVFVLEDALSAGLPSHEAGRTGPDRPAG